MGLIDQVKAALGAVKTEVANRTHAKARVVYSLCSYSLLKIVVLRL